MSRIQFARAGSEMRIRTLLACSCTVDEVLSRLPQALPEDSGSTHYRSANRFTEQRLREAGRVGADRNWSLELLGRAGGGKRLSIGLRARAPTIVRDDAPAVSLLTRDDMKTGMAHTLDALLVSDDRSQHTSL